MVIRGTMRRGEIYIANLDPALGSEEGKERRVLIVSNDIGNSNPKSPVVIIVPFTSKVTPKRKNTPMYVYIEPNNDNGLDRASLIDCGQIRVLDIDLRIGKFSGFVDESILMKVDAALEMVLQLKTCSDCKSVLLPNRNHCVKCKKILVHICIQCHKKISTEYKYCPHCSMGREGYDE